MLQQARQAHVDAQLACKWQYRTAISHPSSSVPVFMRLPRPRGVMVWGNGVGYWCGVLVWGSDLRRFFKRRTSTMQTPCRTNASARTCRTTRHRWTPPALWGWPTASALTFTIPRVGATIAWWSPFAVHLKRHFRWSRICPMLPSFRVVSPKDLPDGRPLRPCYPVHGQVLALPGLGGNLYVVEVQA